MRTSHVLTAGAVAAALALTTAGPASAGPKPPKTSKTKAAPMKMAPPKLWQVAQKNLAFNPTELKITPGDTVEWTNKETDDTTHSVVQGNGTEIDSPDILPGQHFIWKFDFPGEWDIICRFHPDMFLTINVIGKAVPGAKHPSAGMGHTTAPPPPAKNTDPGGSTVPGVPGLPVALHPVRRG